MDRVYITQATYSRIIRELPVEARRELAEGDLEFTFFNFNQLEKEFLLVYRALLRHVEKQVTMRYSKLERGKDLTWVYPVGRPCFHISRKCLLVQKHFENYRIPEVIMHMGASRVEQFRDWFKEHEKWLKTDRDRFLVSLSAAFNVDIRLLEHVKFENSGIAVQIRNMNLTELTEHISEIINASRRFYCKTPKNGRLVSYFARKTWQRRFKSIDVARTGFSEEEVRSFMEFYHHWFKAPLIRALKQYYMVKYSPDLCMDGMLLEQIGMLPCGRCLNYERTEQEARERALLMENAEASRECRIQRNVA